MPDGQGGTWLPLRVAGQRVGLAPDSLRKQAKRGTCRYPTRQDNQGQWFVLLPDSVPDAPGAMTDMPDGRLASARSGVPDTVPDTVPDLPGLTAERDVQIARLEERLAAAEAARATWERERTELRAELERSRALAEAERDRLLTMIAELQRALAERRQPERRPWPGLKAWLRRAWEGNG